MDREIENDGNFYTNEKTEDWLNLSRFQLPADSTTSVLDMNIQQNNQNVNTGPEILDKMPTEKKSTIKSL